MRKLVSIKTIDRIDPIVNADAIVTAVIGGWKAVVKKDEFQVGDKVLYFEVDAFLPVEVPEFEFLAARSSKTVITPDNRNATGHILRTVKLRGTISQGLILPLGWGLTETSTQEEIEAVMTRLGVFKWEPLLTDVGVQVGKFPDLFAVKTDSERVQNLTDEFLASLNPAEWHASEKLDGTSATFLKVDGEFRMASRNWELNPLGMHLHAEIARLYDLAVLLPEGAVVQGEIYGEGVQGNPLRVKGKHLRVFSHSLPEGVEPTEAFTTFLMENSVPVLEDFPFPTTVEGAVDSVNGMRSTINPDVQAEGIVFWHKNGKLFEELGFRPNFKAINNQFLLKLK